MYYKYDKKYYKSLRQRAKQLGVKLGQNETDYIPSEHGYRGITVAFVPSFEGQDCKMLQVSVSYCSVDDEFKKKHGKYHALRKLLDEGEMVQVPLAEFYRDWGAAETGEILIKAFSL